MSINEAHLRQLAGHLRYWRDDGPTILAPVESAIARNAGFPVLAMLLAFRALDIRESITPVALERLLALLIDEARGEALPRATRFPEVGGLPNWQIDAFPPRVFECYLTEK